jgi:hypothetical protein
VWARFDHGRAPLAQQWLYRIRQVLTGRQNVSHLSLKNTERPFAGFSAPVAMSQAQQRQVWGSA